MFKLTFCCYGSAMLGILVTLMTSPNDVTTLFVDTENCTDPCHYYGQMFCGHLPCPLPGCDGDLPFPPGDCCDVCHTQVGAADDIEPTVSTENVTAHLVCPFTCTFGNKTLCVPPPCPPPPCVDPALPKPTDCCLLCPDGPNCRAPDGSIVKYNHWKIIDGKNCTCDEPMAKTTCV